MLALEDQLRAAGITQEMIAADRWDRSTVSRALSEAPATSTVSDYTKRAVKDRTLALVESEIRREQYRGTRVDRLKDLYRALAGRSFPPDILGRSKDRDRLLELVQRPGKIVLVHGSGGIGKSILIASLAPVLRDEGWNLVRYEFPSKDAKPEAAKPWLPGVKPSSSVRAACIDIARELGVTRIDHPISDLVRRLREYDRKLCLVLDSVEEIGDDEVADFLRQIAELLAIKDNIRVVVASRDRRLLPENYTPRDHLVADLDREAAMDLWYYYSNQSPGELFQQAYAAIGGHPLALIVLHDLLKDEGAGSFSQALQVAHENAEVLVDFVYKKMWGRLGDGPQTLLFTWIDFEAPSHHPVGFLVDYFSNELEADRASVRGWIARLRDTHFLLPVPNESGRYYVHALAARAVKVRRDAWGTALT